MKRPHRIMTAEEYEALDLQEWHEVCRNYDGFGGVAIRYLSSDEPCCDKSTSADMCKQCQDIQIDPEK